LLTAVFQNVGLPPQRPALPPRRDLISACGARPKKVLNRAANQRCTRSATHQKPLHRFPRASVWHRTSASFDWTHGTKNCARGKYTKLPWKQSEGVRCRAFLSAPEWILTATAVIWTVLASGTFLPASTARKCKGPLNGSDSHRAALPPKAGRFINRTPGFPHSRESTKEWAAPIPIITNWVDQYDTFWPGQEHSYRHRQTARMHSKLSILVPGNLS